MAMDSDGDFMMRMNDHMAMDMDSGDIHIISSWPDDDRDDFGFSSSRWSDDDD